MTQSYTNYSFKSSFREYLDCSEQVARRICGEETGLFIKEFLRKMSDSLIKVKANNFPKQCVYDFFNIADISELL
jgi:CRISPR type IV-associated protein Csf1